MAKEKIVYKVHLDRTPTLQDGMNKVGLDGFVAELAKKGWADEQARALKLFDIEYEGHSEEGNNYIEWRAILVQN